MRRWAAVLGLAGLVVVGGCVSVPVNQEAARREQLAEQRVAEAKAREEAALRRMAAADRQAQYRMAMGYKSGCPPAVPPASSESVATAADWVELKRSKCADGCPAYTVRVGGDGQVIWKGEGEVGVKGTQYGSVDMNDARALMQRIADRGYWGLCTQYGVANDGWQTLTTTLSLAGKVKTVADSAEMAPSWLRGLDDEIDKFADSHQWRHGGPNDETFAGDHAAVDAVMPKVGVTPLMKAAAVSSNTDALSKQLKLLTDVNARDSSGWTALMYAAQAGSWDGMKMILDNGGDALARTNVGESAMSAAVSAQQGAWVKVQLLYDHGLDVNARDNHGVSPLMLARAYGWKDGDLIPLLLKLGADVQMRDDQGRTADDYWPVGVRLPFVPQDVPVGRPRRKSGGG